MESVELLDEQGRATNCFHSGDAATVRIRYKAAGKLSDVVVGLAVYRSDQTYMFGTNTMIDHLGYAVMEGEGLVELHMQDLALIAGQYTLDLAFHKPDGFAYDFWREACTLQIISDKEESGAVSLKHEWTFH